MFIVGVTNKMRRSYHYREIYNSIQNGIVCVEASSASD